MKFLTNEPAVLLPGRAMVIADLHLGIEHDFRKAGIKMPSHAEKLLEKARRLIKRTKARRLVILGDVKHKVPGMSSQEEREVPHFLNSLNNTVPVEIVPGNHDSGLGRLVPNIKFHPSAGFLLGDAYLSHGHTWPSEDFTKAKHVLVGHNHPMIEFRDRLGYVWREPVWIRVKLAKTALEKKYGRMKKLPELIVFPAYNDFAGGRSLNRRGRTPHLMGPLGRAAKLRSARAYLLDGTFLGELRGL